MFTMGETKDKNATLVYVRSNDDNCWVPARQLKAHNGRAILAVPALTENDMLCCLKAKQRYQENAIIDLEDYPDNVLPKQNVDSNGNLQDFRDMVDLPFMHEVN